MQAPEVQASVTGRVPKYLYTARANKVKAQQERAPKGYMRTVINCEIVAPDIVDFRRVRSDAAITPFLKARRGSVIAENNAPFIDVAKVSSVEH